MKANAQKGTLRQKQARTRRKWIWFAAAAILIAAGGVGAYFWSQSQQKAGQQVSADSTLRTAVVRQGSIRLSATGSGTLSAGQQNGLSFSTTGTVAKLNGQVGDQVRKGQVLAQLDNLESLQASVSAAQQDFVSAQQALDTLKNSAPANIANAQLAVINDQKAILDAQSKVVQPGWARCDQATTDAYYDKYVVAKNTLEKLGDGGGDSGYYLTTILPARNATDRAFAAYEYCATFTSYEIDSSHANLTIAQAKLKTDQGTLDTLNKNGGVDPLALAQAQNKLDTAQLALDQAKQTLDGATLKAPYDGTIVSIAGQAGDAAGTGAFITIADMAHPQISFSVDESDLDKVASGEQAQVVFDAYPNRTFKGKVTRIDPSLTSTNGTQVVTGLIALDLAQEKDLPALPQGLTGTITLVSAEASNVLVVPAQAVRDLGDGTYGVFVIGADNQPRLKIVQVGLQDSASVEIKSGLNAGDVVSTGNAQVKQTAGNQ